MNNTTRDSFDPQKNYEKLLFSQQRAVLDFELNELQERLRYNLSLSNSIVFGNGPVGDSLLVEAVAGSNTVSVRPGVIFHKGVAITLHETSEVALTSPLSDRTDVIYLEWWFEEIDSDTDPDLLLNGASPETATRLKLMSEVNVAAGTAIPVLDEGHSFFILAKLNRLSGDTFVSESQIEDWRVTFADTFVFSGGFIKPVSPSNFSVEAINGRLDGVDFSLDASLRTLSDDLIYYVYVDKDLVLRVEDSLPTDSHLAIAKVQRVSGSAEVLDDLREFSPGVVSGGSGKSSIGGSVVVELITSESLEIHDPVALATDGRAKLGSNTSDQRVPVIGLALNSAAVGKKVRVMVLGIIQDASWVLGNAGSVVYLNGSNVSTTEPTTEGSYLQKLGLVASADSILVAPDNSASLITTVPQNNALASNFIASSTLQQSKVVSLTTSNRRVRLADPFDLSDSYPIGVTKKPILGSSGGPVVTFGEIQDSSWDWEVGQPVYLSVNNGDLVQKPLTLPLERGVTSPIRLERYPLGGGLFSDTDFIIPATYLGVNELIFTDNLVNVRDTNYTRLLDDTGNYEIVRFEFDVPSDHKVFAVFSLPEAGLTLASTLLNAAVEGDNSHIFAVPDGAGPNQIIWLSGLALRYGTQYTRDGDLIIVDDSVDIAPGAAVVGAFSTAANSMMDPVRLAGPFQDPLSGDTWIALLPETAGASFLIFLDGALLEPGDYVVSSDQRIIHLQNVTISDPLPVLTISYSSENVDESGSHKTGYSSAPESVDCSDRNLNGYGTVFRLPLGASSNIIPFVSGLAKVRGEDGNPFSGDWLLTEEDYNSEFVQYVVTFHDPVPCDEVAISYGVRGGGMSNPEEATIRDIVPADADYFSFADDRAIDSESWVWLDGKILIDGVDYEIQVVEKRIKITGLSALQEYSVYVSSPVNTEKMTEFVDVEPLTPTSKSFYLPSQINTGKITLAAIDGKALIFGKDYYRSPNQASFTVREGLVSPNFTELSEAPLAVWQLDDNTNSTVVTEAGSSHPGSLNVSDSQDVSIADTLVSRGFNIDSNVDNAFAVTTLGTEELWALSLWLKLSSEVDGTSAESVLMSVNSDVKLSLGQSTANVANEIISLNDTLNNRTSAVIAGTGDNISSLEADIWHHLAVRYNLTSAFYEIWVNGVQQEVTSGGTGNVQLAEFGASVEVGSNGTDSAIPGILDEVVVWNSELTSADVGLLYNSGDGVHHFAPLSTELMLRRPDLYSSKPTVALVRRSGNASTFDVLLRSGYVDAVANVGDLSASAAALAALNYDVYVFDLDDSGMSSAQNTVAKSLWETYGKKVITIGKSSTTDTYPITAVSPIAGSLNSKPSIFHVVTDDVRDAVNIGGGITNGNAATSLAAEFTEVYRLTTGVGSTGFIGESALGGIWFHDCTAGLARESNGMRILLNVLSYMVGSDISRMPVSASSSLENSSSGLSEVYNFRVGHALSSDTVFVNMQPELTAALTFGGMTDFVPLVRVDDETFPDQIFTLPDGAGYTEVVAIDGFIQRPQIDYIREANQIKFNSTISESAVVSASAATGGKGMSTPQILNKTGGIYALPAFLDGSRTVWVIYDGTVLVPNVHYTISGSELTLIGGLSDPTTMMFSYSLTEQDMSAFEVLDQTTDPQVYNLPSVAGDHLVVTLDGKVLVLGVDYTKIPGNTSLVLTSIPDSGLDLAISYSRRAIQELLSSSTSSSSSSNFWKDPVDSEEDLPSSGNAIGDVRLVTTLGSLHRYTGEGDTGWVKMYESLVADNRISLSFLIIDTLSSGSKKAAVQVPLRFEPQKVIIRSDSEADQDIIIDINKVSGDGTSTSLFVQIMGGQDDRPVLPSGDLYAEITTGFDGVAIEDSFVLTLDVDQCGTSGNEGGSFLYVSIVGIKV